MIVLGGLVAGLALTTGGAVATGAWLDARAMRRPADRHKPTPAQPTDEVAELPPTPIADDAEAWLRPRS
jgi:cytochrome c-type biogenesis protein CcmH/NrfG